MNAGASESAAVARKRRAIVLVVVLVALWPLVHRGLVLSARIDPWELFGWAMYAVPSERVQVGVDLVHGDERERLRPNSDEFAKIQAFAKRRSALGQLAGGEPLAREILRDHPSAEALVVLTRRVSLDPESATLVSSESEERFER